MPEKKKDASDEEWEEIKDFEEECGVVALSESEEGGGLDSKEYGSDDDDLPPIDNPRNQTNKSGEEDKKKRKTTGSPPGKENAFFATKEKDAHEKEGVLVDQPDDVEASRQAGANW